MTQFDKMRALRVLVAPDSFKGSLDAHEVAQNIAVGIQRALPDSVVLQAPIADGGEGTAKTVATRLGGAWYSTSVTDANGEVIAIPFAVCSSAALGEFAIFDVAETVGLPDAKLAPEIRTTRGVGQAVRAISLQGIGTIVIGLGGSSTNDAGAGMLSELMFEFSGADALPFHPVLKTLPAISVSAYRNDSEWLSRIKLIGLTDVTSALTGPTGASHVFGGQKGVADLAAADRAVANFAAQLPDGRVTDYMAEAGAGAAGGLGFAIRILGGTLKPGAEFILDALEFKNSEMNFD